MTEDQTGVAAEGAPGAGQPVQSSRIDRAAAGWECVGIASVDDLIRKGASIRTFRWIDPRPLLISRNDRIARWFGDPTNEERRRWVEAQRARPEGVPEQLVVTRDRGEPRVSFLVIGDTGEGDKSQYFVIKPMQACEEGVDFSFFCSDIIYPAGDVNEYADKFFWPYQKFPGPIYAIPGNHDWYDGLYGFMGHFCNADPDLRPPARPVGNVVQRAIRRVAWRKPSEPDQELIKEMRGWRGNEAQASKQPAPYFAIDIGSILLVGIDTGIKGTLDEDQGRWLREISLVPKPKILLTGKPLYVNGKIEETEIEHSGGTVNEIVEKREHQYIAVLGGDIHNYQRYAVHTDDGREIQHIVCGAGGAYTHATHKIDKINLKGCSEADFRCYPRRGDSLAVFSQLYARRLRWINWRHWLEVPYEQAPEIVAERLRDQEPKDERAVPTRPADKVVKVTRRARIAAKFVYPLPGHGSGPWHSLMSEILDWDEPPPPLFKSFMRVDVSQGQVEMKCFAATGCKEHEENPPLEDWITGSRRDDGVWKWEVNLK
ncbi:MAG: metallophosphoesterase family protein [Gaiellaceae bacterium]